MADWPIVPDVPKKYTSLKSNCLVAGDDSLIKLVLLVMQDINLNFDTSFVKIGQKLTELRVQERRIREQPEPEQFCTDCIIVYTKILI